MARGPRPTPTHLKLLRGNPGKRVVNLREPRPVRPPDIPEPPDYLGGYAAEEWRRVAPELYRLGLLAVVDYPTLAIYCASVQTFRTALEALARVAEQDPVFSALMAKTAKGGVMQNPLFLCARQSANDLIRFSSEFGMTPQARSRINGLAQGLPGVGKFDGLWGG
jgi:P27 family predicted phage terminase small subunit